MLTFSRSESFHAFSLACEGIDKVHLDTLHDNHDAHRFWERLGWSNRNAEIVRFSRILVDNPNA